MSERNIDTLEYITKTSGLEECEKNKLLKKIKTLKKVRSVLYNKKKTECIFIYEDTSLWLPFLL